MVLDIIGQTTARKKKKKKKKTCFIFNFDILLTSIILVATTVASACTQQLASSRICSLDLFFGVLSATPDTYKGMMFLCVADFQCICIIRPWREIVAACGTVYKSTLAHSNHSTNIAREERIFCCVYLLALCYAKLHLSYSKRSFFLKFHQIYFKL